MKLYALCDATTLSARGLSLSNFLQLAKKHQADVIQYRNKTASIDTVKRDLIFLRKHWDETLIINDYVELVPFCDGVHLGQEDILRYGATTEEAIVNIRKLIKIDKFFGISTHNKEEILQANTLDINYIGLGAYRPTNTKDVDTVLGDSLDKLASFSTYPVAAIGGVTFNDTFEHVTYRVMGTALYEN